MTSGRRSWFLAACGQSYCHIELSLELFECFHELTAGFSQRVILDRVRWKLQCLKWPLLWSPQNSICTKVSHDWAYTHTHTHTHTANFSGKELHKSMTARIWDPLGPFWRLATTVSIFLFWFVVVQSLSCVWLFTIPCTAACQASLSFTISQSLLKLMSIESMMPSNHLILCHPLLLLPSIFPSIKVFSSESALHIRWPKYGSFSF